MYLKLNFTADKSLNYIFRVVNEIINTSGITSIATLQSTATAGTWDASLLATLDASNSEIIRTSSALSTTNTKSHYAKHATSPSPSYGDQHYWTVEFSTYDATSTKYYVQQSSGTANTNLSANTVGTSITAGAMASGQFGPTLAPLATTTSTPITVGGTTLVSTANSVYSASGTSGFTNVRTFFMYITDKCMIWSTTNTATYNVGFGATYSDSTRYSGPWIFSQYTRFDYHNTNSNGVIPMLFTNTTRATGAGFGQTINDWSSVDNTQATSQFAQTFRVVNLVNAYPQVGSSWPIISMPPVNWGVAGRFNDYGALNVAAGAAVTSVSGQTLGIALSNTVSTRFPSADLKTLTYGMLPLTWRHLYYYNIGGDSSAQGGHYVFNGDYFPGDEFTYNSKTYKILPTFSGYSQRVGIAVPKE
jgi:hypothetical protein